MIKLTVDVKCTLCKVSISVHNHPELCGVIWSQIDGVLEKCKVEVL